MKKFHITRFAAVTTIAVLVALPALAERGARPRERREPGIVRIVKLAKRILQIAPTGDFPTIPNP